MNNTATTSGLPNLQTTCNIIREIALRELPHRSHITRRCKADGSIVTEADLVVQQAIRAALQEHWPQYGFLGEEMDIQEQESALRGIDTGVWCLDPLDGTNNFAAGIPYYAVSLAFLQGDVVEMGIVYDPTRDECFCAIRGQGAWLNQTPLHVRSTNIALHQSIALIDLKRLPKPLLTRLMTAPPYASQRSFGAVALDWCWLAAGRIHVYLHGKQKLWDYAAGNLILEQAGGQACTLEGQAVYQPGLTARSAAAALDPTLYTAWVDWLDIPRD